MLTDMPVLTLKNSPKLTRRAAEAFNNLRISINTCQPKPRVIFVTSSTNGEGKAFVALHLAEAFARSGKRVCFIDANLRSSTVIRDYKICSSVHIYGLSDYLSDGIAPERILYKIKNMRNAYMIPSGITQAERHSLEPTVLLESKRFKALMDALRNKFDYVVLTCPPIGKLADAKLIAKHCDYALMVIKSNAVTRATAQNTAQLIKACGCQSVGYILNFAD